MRYDINYDKIINQLVPYYMGGKRIVYLLQSAVAPLRSLNEMFKEYVRETRIAACMTSQILPFEWYLNRQLGKYFLTEQKIKIRNNVHLGQVMYFQKAVLLEDQKHMVLYYESENMTDKSRYFTYVFPIVFSSANNSSVFQYKSEQEMNYSFEIESPPIDTSLVSEEDYLSEVISIVERYRLANKTYVIKFLS